MNDFVREEQPIFKAKEKGFDSLTATELITLITGSKKTAIQVCDKAKSYKKLMQLTQKELMQIQGIGETKANILLAAIELANRMQQREESAQIKYDNSADIANYMRQRIGYLDHEEVWVMLLNHNFKLVESKRVSIGGLTETAFDIRIILKEALLNNATIIAVAHNHPSGNPRPSSYDNDVTKKLKTAAQTMRIMLVDHVIVTDNGDYYSYNDEGNL